MNEFQVFALIMLNFLEHDIGVASPSFCNFCKPIIIVIHNLWYVKTHKRHSKFNSNILGEYI